MAFKRLVVADPGTVLATVVNGKKKNRKRAANQIAPSSPATTHELTLNPAKMGATRERTTAFDPRFFLTKLAAGKTSWEYRETQAIFLGTGRGRCGVLHPEPQSEAHRCLQARQRSGRCHLAGR